MRIATWNINSLRLRLPTLRTIVNNLKPDVICLQETKVENSVFPLDEVKSLGFSHVLFQGMKSYNGVAILSRVPLFGMRKKLWCGNDDCRHLAARFTSGTEIHNFYVPAGGDIPNPKENPKFAHKLDFLGEMENWFSNKRPGKRILVGDLNIAPLETDVWSHKQLLNVVSHTPVEIKGLEKVMKAHGWVDAVRHFISPEKQLYTWWSYRNRTWPGSDRGRRLDHIWVTRSLTKNLRKAQVYKETRGWEKPSDHVPLAIDIAID
ncbi:MAG: exodeoxyribonuclease III [Pseudomonadota bacterium]|nr:exodeoxyribonuclease III [Pseudomonadota bacterium]